MNEIKSKKQDVEVDEIWEEMNKGVTPQAAPEKKREIKEEVKKKVEEKKDDDTLKLALNALKKVKQDS